jgi:hypothetical protein
VKVNKGCEEGDEVTLCSTLIGRMKKKGGYKEIEE